MLSIAHIATTQQENQSNLAANVLQLLKQKKVCLSWSAFVKTRPFDKELSEHNEHREHDSKQSEF